MSGSVLIVDDQKNTATLTRNYLTKKGYRVRVVHNLKSARKTLKNSPRIDLLLLHTKLPDGDGYTLLKEIRAGAESDGLPVIMTTAEGAPVKDKVKGFKLGADDFLVKPFEMAELKARMDRLIVRSSSVQTYSSSSLGEIFSPSQELVPQKDNLPVALPAEIRSFFDRFLSLLLEPKIFLDGWKDLLNMRFVLVLLSLSAVFKGIQMGLERASVMTGLIGGLVAFIGALTAMGALAWSLQWQAGLSGNSVSLRKACLALGAGWAPLLLDKFLGAVYGLVPGSKGGDFTVGPLLLFSMQSTDTFLGFFLRHLDIFELWAIGLAVLALNRIAGIKLRAGAWWAALVWGIAVVGIGVLKAVIRQ